MNNISESFRFAHLADCHIGGWKEEELKELSIRSFREATEKIIDSKVNFLIIAGDLFNTSIPSIDAIKEVALCMKKVKDNNIKIYIIPGSHDYSPSGKTMLDVLENAGLCINVYKYHEETKRLEITYHQLPSGERIALTGMCGLAGGLEKIKYEELANRSEIENLSEYKIFLFHTLLSELKPTTKDWEKVPSEPLGLLPKNFNYYPGGHPHFVKQKSTPEYPLIAYPGPLFPNNFKELEELKQGGFYIVDVNNNNTNLTRVPIKLKEIISLNINAENKTPEEINLELREELTKINIIDAIITIRIAGTLRSGKPSDVEFKKIISENQDAYIILKNTSKLKTKEFSEIKIQTGNIEEVEEAIIKDHIGQIELPDIQLNENQEILTNQLMVSLNKEKIEGEKNIDFETRIIKDAIEIFNLGDIFNAN
ncbi:DNA repair exonuclease [Candidatus Woesearchaeota archaeon]|jgi:DNA repair protein SbcD/Mre11|nr:DNA repair exonuclease [Candidatus Woesearchaeota archaeon]MBT5215961.1 DNA repair exonuclease [Candidatus Woesearchaeota archaeon]MBT6402327.1 DNA repair exonuclease [Candidatus Woesearchaeota archaeon]